jgi:hypothetical protein
MRIEFSWGKFCLGRFHLRRLRLALLVSLCVLAEGVVVTLGSGALICARGCDVLGMVHCAGSRG